MNTLVGKKAVAAHKWERDPDNFYTEERWCSERFFEVEKFHGKIVEPCAGSGNIANSARAAGYECDAFDLRDRDVEGVVPNMDFFKPWTPGYWPVDNIVSNPPYGAIPAIQRLPNTKIRFEDRFVELALERVRSKVAVFLPAGWINSDKRGRWLETMPLYRVYKIGPRPSCPPGHLVMQGVKPGDGKVDFSWYVFLKGYEGPYTGHWLRRDREATS